MLEPEEIRLLGLSAPLLLRMLKRREERVLNKIYGEFTNGKHDQLTNLAEWASLQSQIRELNAVLAQHHSQEEKRHANGNSNAKPADTTN